MSGFPVSLQQSSIDGVIYLISKIRLYEGIPKDDGYFPKSLYEEKIFNIYDNRSNNFLKSKFCKQFLDWLSKNIACSFCQDALHVRKGREKRRKISVSRKNKKKDVIVVNNQDSKMSFNQQDKKVLHVQEKESIQNTVITPEKESPKDLPDAIILEKEDHDDMETILSYVVENNLPDKFVVLLKSQLQNCKKDLEIHQRR